MRTLHGPTFAGWLDTEELGLIDGYWRAANYLSVARTYMLDHPLLGSR
jgi:xylulose-5-phosphate/fructose-6-phosphate phosphoketolase